MDKFEEPDDFYGVPLEEFVSPYLLNQLEPEDIPYLRTLVICKLYDVEERQIARYHALASSILDGYRGTNQSLQKSAPK
mgnify:CR=1 FL=1